MTDKQIMIDGYNLEYIKKLLYNGQRSAISTNIFEAIIEQLECKEQECERLSFDNFDLNDRLQHIEFILETAKGTVKFKEQQLDQLKADNEELKSLLKVRIEDLCDSCGASSMKLMPCKVYEKTLTEIKELLLKTPTDSQKHCVNAKSVILQKISECEEQQ